MAGNSLSQKIEKLKNRVSSEAVKAEEKVAKSKPKMFLKGVGEHMRAMPNHLARSSLFAPVARGRRKMHDAVLLHSRCDAEIRYSGKQLDESQADVWMQCLAQAANYPLGTPVPIVRAHFLDEIGKKPSGQNYKWLHDSMKDLCIATLVVEVVKVNGVRKVSIGKTEALHLISKMSYDDETEQYSFEIDPRWALLFSNEEFARIDWQKRMQIDSRQVLAKSMQRLIATSSNSLQRYSLEYLRRRAQSEGRMRDFKAALAGALAELVRVGAIKTWKFEKSVKGLEQVCITVREKAASEPPEPDFFD